MSHTHVANAYQPGIVAGTFIKSRLRPDKTHVTITVEGNDEDGPSVAGIALSVDELDKLIKRLTNIRDQMRRS